MAQGQATAAVSRKLTGPELADRILRQGKALVRAIEALSTTDSSGPIGRAAARLLLYAYKRRLRGVVPG